MVKKSVTRTPTHLLNRVCELSFLHFTNHFTTWYLFSVMFQKSYSKNYFDTFGFAFLVFEFIEFYDCVYTYDFGAYDSMLLPKLELHFIAHLNLAMEIDVTSCRGFTFYFSHYVSVSKEGGSAQCRALSVGHVLSRLLYYQEEEAQRNQSMNSLEPLA